MWRYLKPIQVMIYIKIMRKPSSDSRTLCSSCGFTLVELLAVVAIIAILSALLLPIFIRIREKAHQSQCLSNQKQISLALLQYIHDNDEYFPCGTQPYSDGALSGVGWSAQIYPFIRNASVFTCPDDTTQATASTATGLSAISYAINGNISYDRHGYAAGFTPVLQSNTKIVLLVEVTGVLANVVNPQEQSSSDYPACANGRQGHLFTTRSAVQDPQHVKYAAGIMGDIYRSPEIPIEYQSITGRHQLGANYLFVDGHAKYLLPVQVSPGTNATTNDSDQDPVIHSRGITVDDGAAAGTENPRFVATFSTR